MDKNVFFFIGVSELEKKRKSVLNPFEYYHWAFESRLVTVHQEKAVVM